MRELSDCRFCGSRDKTLWVGNYFRCNECLFISTDPAPTNDEIDRHYKGYHENNHQASAVKNEKRAISYGQEVSWLKSLGVISDVATVFDYGGSGGYFLDVLSEHTDSGAIHYACDLAAGAEARLKEKGYFKSLDEVPAGSIDLFVMRGVIEHVVDFKGLLDLAASKISRGGYFFITATPDASCTVANRYRDAWVQHHYPSHFQHFSSHHIDELLGAGGMAPHAVTELYFDSPYREVTDDLNWLQFLSDTECDTSHAYWGSMMTRLYRKIF
jgi:hypothetical protein